MKFLCKICNNEFPMKSYKIHLKESHGLNDTKDYLKFIGFNNICNMCGCETSILNLTEGFKRYCKPCSSKSPEVKARRKNTNMIKFGSTTPAGNPDVIKKQRKTINERFGCHHLSLKEIQDKRKHTCFEKYGFDNAAKSKYTKDKIQNSLKDKYEEITSDIVISHNMDYYTLKCHLCNGEYETHRHLISYRKERNQIFCTSCNKLHSTNDMQLEVFNFVKDICNDEVIFNSRKIISPLELDIYIPSKKLAIEFNGLNWHSEEYVDKDYHLKKTEECEKLGIHLIHIYEDDWLYKQNIVKSRLKSILGLSERRIFARKCIINELDNKTSSEFFDKNHIQGGGPNSKYRFGLFYNNELAAVMTFGASRFEKNKIELHRFANKLGSNVIGGASKLFKHFIRQNICTEIISYADRSWSQGKLYETLGFELIGKTKPNYSYIINKHRTERFKFKKSELIKAGFDSNKTEVEIMKERKYFKIFDSGSLKYKYYRGFEYDRIRTWIDE